MTFLCRLLGIGFVISLALIFKHLGCGLFGWRCVPGGPEVLRFSDRGGDEWAWGVFPEREVFLDQAGVRVDWVPSAAGGGDLVIAF